MKTLIFFLCFMSCWSCTLSIDDDKNLKKKTSTINGEVGFSAAKLWGSGAQYSSFETCTPLHADLKGPSNYQRYLSEDVSVEVRVAPEKTTKIEIYSDGECAKVVSGEADSSGNISAKFTLKAESSSVTAYVKASATDIESSGKFAGRASFEFVPDGDLDFKEGASTLWFSDQFDANPKISLFNVFKTTQAVAGTCTRLEATMSDSNTIGVSKDDIIISFDSEDDKNIGRIYSDQDCKNPSSTITLLAGTQSVSFWVQVYEKFELRFSAPHGPENHYLQIDTP